MRFSLLTLMVVVAVGPPLIAAIWFDFAIVLVIGIPSLGFALGVPFGVSLIQSELRKNRRHE